MKLEIEITEEDAAALMADHWDQKTVEEIILGMVEDAAAKYRAAFPPGGGMARELAAQEAESTKRL